jgi:type IV pilus assembly protein PilY1
MKNLTQILSTLAGALAISAFVGNASAQSIGDYSTLPETMITPPDQTPRILLVLDTSGSMQFDDTGAQIGGSDPRSRSALVRQAFREFLPEMEGIANIGLMIYGAERTLEEDFCHLYPAPFDGQGFCNSNLNIEDWNYSSCNGFESTTGANNCSGSSGTVKYYDTSATGKGLLISNVEPLTQTKLGSLTTLLGAEPVPPILTDDYTIFSNFYQTNVTIDVDASFNSRRRIPYPNPDSALVNGVPMSAGGTPISGTLASAKTYLTDFSNLPAGEQDLGSGTSIVDPLTTPSINTSLECRPSTYVFFLTDGLPTVAEDGSGDSGLATPKLRAQELKDLGIPVWMFGFGLNAAAQTSINEIAQAGGDQDAFFSSNVEDLKDQLRAAFDRVTLDVGSSSGVSVVASSAEGAGSVVQAIYNPELTVDTGVLVVGGTDGETIKETVNWTSTLSAYFVDEFGYLREDNGNGILEDYAQDSAFKLEFNGLTRLVEVVRITPTDIGTSNFEEVINETVALEELVPIWEASEVLSKHDQTDPLDSTVNVYGSRQRPYDQVASSEEGYRHIVTWMQTNPRNQEFSVGSKLDFTFTDTNGATSINAKNYKMLDAGGATDAEEKINADKVIRYIRGEEGITGFRSRTADGQAYLLGDIVHSTAAQVDKPSQNFDSLGDDSYRAFKDHWEDQDRRRVVYVGGNDGMLHAFNGGFYDGEAKKFSQNSSGYTPHELGAELWGYVPMNLLPHLKFLTQPTYNSSAHVAYVDGAVQEFDVRIFEPDNDTHINGWGTIIVAGMRLGGGEYPGLDYNANNASNADYTAKSAYIILDVTDPEVPPVPLGEITHSTMGFTTGLPTVSRENCDADLECDWFLVMGSGPNDLATVTSSRKQRLFRYKLDHDFGGLSALDTASDGKVFHRFGEGKSFVGDIVAQDWDNDYEHDALYFGTVAGTVENALGGVSRYSIDNDAISTLNDTDRPVPYRPLLRRFGGQNWVFFGTGRYFTIDDVEDNFEQNRFYGIYEPRDNDGVLTYNTVQENELVDVSGVEVKVDGTFNGQDAGGETNVAGLKALIASDGMYGWYTDLPGGTANPSRKTSASALAFRNFLFFTDFEPAIEDANICEGDFGTSYLNVVDLTTGVAPFINADGFDGPLGEENGIITSSTVIGQGYANQSFLFVGPDPETGKSRVILKTPLATGQIADTTVTIPPGTSGRTSWRELEIK